MIDIHTHILPGIDDGASSWDVSLEMAACAVADGIDGIVCSPHQCDGLYDVSNSKILDLVAEFDRRLTDAGIDLQVYAGGDIHIHPEIVESLKSGSAMTINSGNRYLLVEMPHSLMPQHVPDTIFNLQLNNYISILTHPERNSAIQDNIDLLEPLVHCGCLMQVTAGSLVGFFGSTVEKCAWEIVKRGWCHLVASDAHSNEGRIPVLSEARELIKESCGSELAGEIFDIRPENVLSGKSISVEKNFPKEEKRKFWQKLKKVMIG